LLAPLLANNKSIFEYIQMFQGFVSTGILAVFIYGLLNRSSGPWAGVIGLVANPIFYAFFQSKVFVEKMWPSAWGECNFLYSMSLSLERKSGLRKQHHNGSYLFERCVRLGTRCVCSNGRTLRNLLVDPEIARQKNLVIRRGFFCT